MVQGPQHSFHYAMLDFCQQVQVTNAEMPIRSGHQKPSGGRQGPPLVTWQQWRLKTSACQWHSRPGKTYYLSWLCHDSVDTHYFTRVNWHSWHSYIILNITKPGFIHFEIKRQSSIFVPNQTSMYHTHLNKLASYHFLHSRVLDLISKHGQWRPSSTSRCGCYAVGWLSLVCRPLVISFPSWTPASRPHRRICTCLVPSCTERCWHALLVHAIR